MCIDSNDSEIRRILQHFSRSTRLVILCIFGVEVEKNPGKNHPVDTIEKTENVEVSENINNKRNENYITPNNRLTRFVQQRPANTRLYKKLRLLQRRQSEPLRFQNFSKKRVTILMIQNILKYIE